MDMCRKLQECEIIVVTYTHHSCLKQLSKPVIQRMIEAYRKCKNTQNRKTYMLQRGGSKNCPGKYKTSLRPSMVRVDATATRARTRIRQQLSDYYTIAHEYDNPFTASINLLDVTTTVTYQQLTIGKIDHVDLSFSPVHVNGHSTVTSLQLPFKFNLNPLAII
ncbi:hypothetical protein EDB87DRAFT_403745 [Lactarius vividus]|nr:hypothetical protein EDB87DRAFT_403745 [Lactarius vividus]